MSDPSSDETERAQRELPVSAAVADADECCEESGDEYDEHSVWASANWPAIDPDVEGIVTRVDMASRSLERAAAASREQVGLAHGEVKILLRLARGRRSQGQLAKNLLVSTGTMTNQLDKLEAGGLVTRLPDPSDRRGKLVEMTSKGRETLDAYVNLQAHRENDLVGGLSEGERKALNSLLRKLLVSLSQRRTSR